MAATLFILIVFITDIISHGMVRSLARAGAADLDGAASSVASFFMANGYVHSRAQLIGENEALQARVNTLSAQAQMYTTLQDENRALAALVHLAQTTRGVTATIDSSFDVSPYGTFLVGAGSAQGIQVGDIVLTDQDLVLGTVANVGPNHSLVTEVFAPGRSVEGTIDGSPATIGGRGGGNAYAALPQSVPVHAGDRVVVPGFGMRTVGVVGNVSTNAATAANDVFIGLPVNVHSLRYVFIVGT